MRCQYRNLHEHVTSGISLSVSCKPPFHSHTPATSFYVGSGSGSELNNNSDLFRTRSTLYIVYTKEKKFTQQNYNILIT